MMQPVKSLALALAVVILPACAVGPNFKPPPAPQTPGFLPAGQLPAATASAPVQSGAAQSFVDDLDIPGQWWTLFNSPALDALIKQGLANSPTLQAAQAALRNANETTAAERGSYYPSVSGTYSGERQKASGAAFGQPSAGATLYSINSASVSVSYTLDVFGGTRRQVEALDAQADYERFTLEASYLTLTANIVTAAITEASLRAQIAATEEVVKAERTALDITQARFTAGGVARSDVLTQQSTLQSTLATLPPLRSQLAQERAQLATYVGTLPADYHGGEITLDALTLPSDLPVSIPSKFVEQRPDVREYSALLHKATAQVGVDTANMLPQFTITGSYGGESIKFRDLLSPASVVYSLLGSVTQPIFKGGQLLHTRRASIAAAQEAAANYQATVLTAFQNVASTLYALQSDAEALNADTLAERTAEESLRLVQFQFKSGAASYLQVLTSEQTYQNTVVTLVKARAQRFADTAALFQALGGGWWNRADVAANSTDCCKEKP